MNLTPPKIIGREACLQAKDLFRLSKDLGPKICLNILRKEDSKEIRDFVKVDDGGVNHNTMGLIQNNELEFQKPFEHHPF